MFKTQEPEVVQVIVTLVPQYQTLLYSQFTETETEEWV